MRLTKPFFWLLTFLWFFVGLWWYHCSDCSGCCTDKVSEIPTGETPNLPSLSISDGSWNFNPPGNIKFGKSNFLPVFDNGVKYVMDSLALYSTLNPGKSFKITGRYSLEEQNTTTFPNLGVARAEELKKQLVARGLSPNVITTDGVLADDLTFYPADTLVGGVSFDISGDQVIAETIDKPAVDDLLGPRTVYFNTGKVSLKVDDSLEKYLRNAKSYLASHTDVNLVVTGHTDNVGNPENNRKLSLDRANFVSSELIKNGIDKNRISTEGKGDTEPISDNATQEGRADNRRVIIQIK